MVDVRGKVGARSMLGDIAVALVGAMAKLCVNGGEYLFRGRRASRDGKSIAVVNVRLVQDGVFCGGRD